MSRKVKFRGWDQRVKEAQRPAIEFEVNGQTIKIEQPTGRTIRALENQGEEDIDSIVKILFGDNQARILLDAWNDVPYDVLPNLITDIMDQFGVTNMGNLQATSN